MKDLSDGVKLHSCKILNEEKKEREEKKFLIDEKSDIKS
jgi:hypothetical protein